MRGLLITLILTATLGCKQAFDIKWRTTGEQFKDLNSPKMSPPPNRLSTTVADSTHYIHNDGRLFSWGGNWNNQLADGTTTSTPTPVAADFTPLGLSNDFRSLAVPSGSNYHMCAIHQTGKLVCWGPDWVSGGCGNGDSVDPCGEPQEVMMDELPYENDFNMVAIGADMTCALHANKKILCWGASSWAGELGVGDTNDYFKPQEIDMTALPEDNEFKYVAVGGDHACGIHESSKLFCWGNNWRGAVGNGLSGMGVGSLTPEEVDMSALTEDNSFYQVSLGSHTCGLHENKKIFCWGSNSGGQLAMGSDDSTAHPLPQEIYMTSTGKANNFVQISSSDNGNCAIHQDGELYCWGYNGGAAFTNGDYTDQYYPYLYDMTSQSVTENFVGSTLGYNSTWVCSIHQNEKLYCSGDMWEGMGDAGASTQSTTPLEVDMSGM